MITSLSSLPADGCLGNTAVLKDQLLYDVRRSTSCTAQNPAARTCDLARGAAGSVMLMQKKATR